MSFIDLVEQEQVNLRMTADQKRVCKDLVSMDWTIVESSDNGNPVVQKPNASISFEITESGKLEEFVGA